MSGVLLLLISAFLLTTVKAQPLQIDPVVIGAGNSPGSCPSNDTLQSARKNTSEAIQVILDSPCGGAFWIPVVSLDMGDSSQQCLSPWTEISTPVRSCTNDNCRGPTFPVSGLTYSRVCGRATGYGGGSPDAFNRFGINDGNIDSAYLDGISVTHGTPRQHIWSFASDHNASPLCPCDNSDRFRAPSSPLFVGDNYFCDTTLNGALWDAMDCTTACCTFHSPPWFSVTLPSPTSDDIEVRICSDEDIGNEAIHLRLLELYVQ